jgi:hypothetical protein
MKRSKKMKEETTTAICDLCGADDNDTPENLKRNGWYLGAREEFCSQCND